MRIVQLTPLAKARVWVSESATFGVEFTGAISGSFVAARTASPEHAAVTVEALVPRGAMAEYGLVGLDFQSIPSETSRVEVGCSVSEGMRWDKSIAATIDDVRLGLSEEYSQAVCQALSSAATTKLGPGVLRLVEAAHGAVGSSPSFFAKLSFAAVELMFVDVSDASDELLAELLRRILVG
ncbi:hypothetical protein WME98_19285 [Sorangium sp. So ce296]|uniref:hypothetical protein n=1 Tax=Sorangium sp. So ce296 TaxID=3133296 RepID=UPI003F630200